MVVPSALRPGAGDAPAIVPVRLRLVNARRWVDVAVCGSHHGPVRSTRHASALLLLAATSLGCPPDRPPPARPPRLDQQPAPPTGLLSWPRMRADQFGCLLETRHAVRDPRWSCARPDPGPRGDPCLNTRAYYDGPGFPDEAAARLAPGVEGVRLSWEHRDLQSVVIVLRGLLSEADARRRLGLPAVGAALPPNVQRIGVQGCARDRTCVDLVGFDHMGAGEVECPR